MERRGCSGMLGTKKAGLLGVAVACLFLAAISPRFWDNGVTKYDGDARVIAQDALYHVYGAVDNPIQRAFNAYGYVVEEVTPLPGKASILQPGTKRPTIEDLSKTGGPFYVTSTINLLYKVQVGVYGPFGAAFRKYNVYCGESTYPGAEGYLLCSGGIP